MQITRANTHTHTHTHTHIPTPASSMPQAHAGELEIIRQTLGITWVRGIQLFQWSKKIVCGVILDVEL